MASWKPRAEGAACDLAPHLDQAVAFSFQAQHLGGHGGFTLLECSSFCGGLQQRITGAEVGQFALELIESGLQRWGLLVEEIQAVGQATLTLLQRRLEVGVAQGLEQTLVFNGVAACDAYLQHSLGFLAFGTTAADGNAADQGTG